MKTQEWSGVPDVFRPSVPFRLSGTLHSLSSRR